VRVGGKAAKTCARLGCFGGKGAVKKINTQARATILWKLGLVDAAKKEA